MMGDKAIKLTMKSMVAHVRLYEGGHVSEANEKIIIAKIKWNSIVIKWALTKTLAGMIIVYLLPCGDEVT